MLFETVRHPGNYYHKKSIIINLTETKPACVPFNGRMDYQTRLCLWTFHTPALSLRLLFKNAKSGTLLTRELWANKIDVQVQLFHLL